MAIIHSTVWFSLLIAGNGCHEHRNHWTTQSYHEKCLPKDHPLKVLRGPQESSDLHGKPWPTMHCVRTDRVCQARRFISFTPTNQIQMWSSGQEQLERADVYCTYLIYLSNYIPVYLSIYICIYLSVPIYAYLSHCYLSILVCTHLYLYMIYVHMYTYLYPSSLTSYGFDRVKFASA